MKLLEFLFNMGIVFIILSLIWGFFMMVLNMLAMGERKGIFEENILKSANYYLLASLSAIVVIAQVKLTGVTHYGYQIAGLLMLYLYLVGKQEQQRFQIALQRGTMGNFKLKQNNSNKTLDTIYLLATLTLYAVCVMEPSIANNPVTQWFMQVIIDIKDTAVIGWIIKIIGVFFLISIFVRGLAQTQKLLGQNGQSNDSSGTDTRNDDDFDDYEIVE